MPTETFLLSPAGSLDGWVRRMREDETFLQIRNGAGTEANDGDTVLELTHTIEIGENEWWDIYRTITIFDTSELPVAIKITSAFVRMHIFDRDENYLPLAALAVFESFPNSDSEVVPADYQNLGTTPLSTPILIDDLLENWQAFPLNEAGLGKIIPGGKTKLGFREATYDAAEVEPPWQDGANWKVRARSKEYGLGLVGYLSVTYEYMTLPEVRAKAATGIGVSQATLNGIITDDGGGVCQYRFRYKKSGGSYSYTSWTGSKETNETFSEAISGLDSNSLYYFNAQAKNLEGESDWGNEMYFVTLSPRATVDVEDVITLEAIRKMEMAAMSRFYISEEGKATYKSRFARSG